MKKIVVALGGNAILSDDPSAVAQYKALEDTAECLVQLIEQGNNVIISHGNGPQVGNLLLQQQGSDSKENPAMPLDTCVAMTQGSIGYWLQNALAKALKKHGIQKDVVTVVTQAIVDEQDPAFSHPTKPIGPFKTKAEVDALSLDEQKNFIEDSGRGYRKVVPSPRPVGIVEAAVIKQLVDSGIIVIATGGGGIPVVAPEMKGVEAVIDKDFASEKLAELVDADTFIVLTGVDNVCVNFNTPNQKALIKTTPKELKKYISENQFAQGSMLPKVEAAILFAEYKQTAEAIITSLTNIENLVKKAESGTRITND